MARGYYSGTDVIEVLKKFLSHPAHLNMYFTNNLNKQTHTYAHLKGSEHRRLQISEKHDKVKSFI